MKNSRLIQKLAEVTDFSKHETKVKNVKPVDNKLKDKKFRQDSPLIKRVKTNYYNPPKITPMVGRGNYGIKVSGRF